MSRRRWGLGYPVLSAASRLAAYFGFAMWVGTAEAETVVINTAGQSLTSSAIYLARDLGFFQREGLTLEYVNTGAGIKSITPLINGAAQFCACIVFHPIQANQTGAGDVRLFAGIAVGAGTKILLRSDLARRLDLSPSRPLAERVAMLKGLTIGVTELGASTDQALRVTLRTYGLNPDRDVTIIPLGHLANMAPAIANRQVDALSGSPPLPEQLIKAGDAELLADPVGEHVGLVGNQLFMALAANRPFLETHGDLARRVVRAVAAAQAVLRNDKTRARAVLKAGEFAQMPQDVFDASFDAQYPSYQWSPEMRRDSVEAAIALARQFIPGLTVTYDTLVDPSVVAGLSP